jgi:D-arabinose 5-phosphate isomerase GutQ
VPDEVRRVLQEEATTLERLASTLDLDAIGRLVDLLVESPGRVRTMGCGTSGAAARKIAHTLTCVGCSASFLTPSDAPHGALGEIRPGDIVMLVSKGGDTRELAELVPNLRALGATIVGVTEAESSIIGAASDLLVRVRVDSEPDPTKMLATASTLAVMATMDAVAICVAQRNGFDRRRFGLIHPGGAVGGRLTSSAPTVSPEIVNSWEGEQA